MQHKVGKCAWKFINCSVEIAIPIYLKVNLRQAFYLITQRLLTYLNANNPRHSSFLELYNWTRSQVWLQNRSMTVDIKIKDVSINGKCTLKWTHSNIVSEWFVFNAKWTIFQPYHGENKLHSMRWCTPCTTDQTHLVGFLYI
jgi:hypothetical protein